MSWPLPPSWMTEFTNVPTRKTVIKVPARINAEGESSCAHCHRPAAFACKCSAPVCWVHAWFLPQRVEAEAVNATKTRYVAVPEDVRCLEHRGNE
jgi:hypothetical protein